MKYSKKKYLDYMVRTIDALNSSDSQTHIFINNPGFGNIFDILKNESYRKTFNSKLEEHYGTEYSQTIIKSLKRSSLNSFYTPEGVVNAMSDYLKWQGHFTPKTILEPSAGNGVFIRRLLKQFPDSKFTAFEKEILTVRILEHNFKNHTNVRVYGTPFENFNQTDATKKYDLVISNIPFGANKIFDPGLSGHPLQSQLSKNIHSYFVHKSLECLAPSGISILICTKNFMDKGKYAAIREHLMLENNLLGAVRLPDTTFAQENTSVVTDIMIFQNKNQIETSVEQDEINSFFSRTVEKEIGDNAVQISEYFDKNPEHILGVMEEGGLYSNLDYTVKADFAPTMLEEKIGGLLSTFQFQPKTEESKEKGILAPMEEAVAKQPKIETDEQVLVQNEVVKDTNVFTLKPGNLTIKHQKVFKIDANNDLEPVTVKAKEFDRLSKIVALRDTYFKLLESATDNYDKVRDELDYQYEAFHFQYGRLNDKPNYHFVTLDVQGPLLWIWKPQKMVFL